MYTESFPKDVFLFFRALASNQLARFAPSLYATLTGNTGRGDDAESPAADVTAKYFWDCFYDYFDQLGVARSQIATFVSGKKILEYGPGDTMGVALLMYAHGAESVDCVDQFPLLRANERTLAVYEELLKSMPEPERQRAASAFSVKGDARSGFAAHSVRYSVTPLGLSGQADRYDLIISRAVLEHVASPVGTLRDIRHSLKPGGMSLHKIDFTSHGIDRYRPLDFLTWSNGIYRLMFDQKGCPNRWRPAMFSAAARNVAGLTLKGMTPGDQWRPEEVRPIMPHLARELQGSTIEELCWKNAWLVLERSA
jgi:SAM-dependent methyltransferase